MKNKVETFIKEYVRAITEGYAAIFAGAGLSCGAGYVNWKELMRPFAEEIDMDVDREDDLVAIAQYYRNENGTRADINQRILNEFTQKAQQNENIEIVTRLPIHTYWTTNYDQLIEENLKKNNRKTEIKITQETLANNMYDRDAVVYKMHGDANFPQDAVLTKDDYEMYEYKRPLFRTLLQGDLISKTFLFIGFSFEDPNLDYILSQIRVLLGESSRIHYCFFEKVKQCDGEDMKEYLYNKAKQELRIKDLKRYGIKAVLLDSYSEITNILRQIEHGCLLKNVFISGSLAEPEDSWSEQDVNTFTYGLSNYLVRENYKVISGFGLGIGSTVINGALDEIYENKYKHIDENLSLRPFPQTQDSLTSLESRWKEYREDMIRQAGIVVFIFGNKRINDDIIVANGMIEEFEIAMAQNKIIIPVGCTGGAASIIHDRVVNNIDNYPYLKDYIEDLKKPQKGNGLIELVVEIIREQQIISN